MTRRAPTSSSLRPSSAVLSPPPTWHGSRPQMLSISARFSPCRMAASRSISCTSGYFANRSIQYSKSSNASFSFSPWTNCTIRPPSKSIEGINMALLSQQARAPPGEGPRLTRRLAHSLHLLQEESRRRSSPLRIALGLQLGLRHQLQALQLKLQKKHPGRIPLEQQARDPIARDKKTAVLRPPDQKLVRDLVQQRKPSPDVDPLPHGRVAPTRHRPYHPRTLHRERGMAVAAASNLAEMRSEE